LGSPEVKLVKYKIFLPGEYSALIEASVPKELQPMPIAEDLAQIARPEAELIFSHFDYDTAWHTFP
jgi:hypothetical protein